MPPPPPQTTNRAYPAAGRLWPVAVFLALASMLVRSRHLDWGLPDLEDEAFPLKKAFEMCGWGGGGLRLDPETAGWPSLSFYVHMAVQHLQYGLGRLTGSFADGGDFFLQRMTWTPLAVWARAVGVLASGVVVFAGTRLGDRLAGRGGALVAGTLLAVSPMLTRHAQLITPDILLVMFAALALDRLVAVSERGLVRDYVWAAVWIGLGVSAKYTPALLLPVLYLAHLLRRHRAGLPLRRAGFDDRRLWLAVAACLAAFVVTSPYVLADLGVLARDVDYQVMHMQEGHFGHESQDAGLVFYALDVLAPGLGWPAFLLGLTGLLAATAARRGSWWIVLAAFLVFYVPLSQLQTRFDRYMLPALLPLALGAAGWWALLAPRVRVRGRVTTAVVLGGFVLAGAVMPALETTRFLARQGRPGTLQLARDWILQHRRDGGPFLAMELYSPNLPRAKQIELRRHDPAFARLSPAQRQRWLDIDPVHLVYLPFYTTRRGAADFYYDLRHYLAYDYVVTSSRVRGRYERNLLRYRRQVDFYADLQEYAPPIRVFAPGDDRRGPEIRIHAVTDRMRTRLADEKPPVSQEDFRRAAGEVVGSHFRDFVKTVAEHAAARGYYAIAATYYQPLYETTPPEQREAILPLYASALLRAERWEQVEPLLQHWRRSAPVDPRPAGYLGLAHKGLGRREEARVDFATCLQLARSTPQHAELAAWAQRQLDALAGVD